MNDILVRPVELRQAAEQLRSSAQKINRALQSIDNDINALKGATFMGNRATVLQSHYAIREDALLKASRLVLHFSEDLKIAASRFESADKKQNVAYSSERRMQLTREMKIRYNELIRHGEEIGTDLTPDTTDVFDDKVAINTVLLNSSNRNTIENTARKYNIDPALLAGVVAVEMDLDYDRQDALQDGLGRLGILNKFGFLLGNGSGVANVHNESLKTAIQYLENHKLPGTDNAKNYDWSWENRSSFNGSVEAAAIVVAMYSNEHGSITTSEDMAVIWGAYKTGIKGFVPDDTNYGYETIEDFKNHIARDTANVDVKFQMGKNAYYAQPYFEYFKETFASPPASAQELPIPQIVPTPTPNE